MAGITYVEMRSVLARAVDGRRLRVTRAPRVIRRFKEDWEKLARIWPSPELMRFAGEVAHKRKLRGFDAVQLASCLRFAEVANGPLLFLSFDVELNEAARQEGLATYPNATT